MTAHRGLAAEFASADAMLDAVHALRARGYREIEMHSPFPVESASPSSERRPYRLARIAFVGGGTGAILGYGIQWYANVWHYPLHVGGRPAHAVPAFALATFEAAILGAALATFVGLLVLLRLPALWHPVFEVDGFERASIDRFWIAVDERDPLYDAERTRAELAELTTLRITRIEAPDR